MKESLLLQVMSGMLLLLLLLLLLLKLKSELTKFLRLRSREGSEWCSRRRLKCLWWSGRS